MTVGWSQTGYADVAALVRERTGLIFPEGRVRDVETTVQRTMARRGIDNLPELLTLLRDDDRAREAFVADLTIGESYFQRDPAQFTLLRERILPSLLSSRTKDRPIRVWSAGCAAGEEPYTVAMMFEELGAADRCDIVGTDIARARLAEAQRGLYSKWQLRATPEPVRRRYFAEHGRYFELSPRIRRNVDFRYLNLAEDSFPSLTTGIWGMDLILCRNVLIYFDAPTVARVASRLIATLSEDGWLLMGASDPAITEFTECDAVLTDAGLAYRRKGAAGPTDLRADRNTDWSQQSVRLDPHAAASAAPVDDATRVRDTFDVGDVDAYAPVDDGPAFDPAAVRDEHVPGPLHDPIAESGGADGAGRNVPPAEGDGSSDEAIMAAYGRRDFAAVQTQAVEAEAVGVLGCAGWVAWVRALANEGRLDEGAVVLDRALRHGASAELLYLQAVLLLQAGRAVDAAAAARRALYLDRSLVVAHLTLGEAQRRTGSADGARRSLRNAAALLAALDPDTVVTASDGERAGRLGELVRVKLKLLGGAE